MDQELGSALAVLLERQGKMEAVLELTLAKVNALSAMLGLVAAEARVSRAPDRFPRDIEGQEGWWKDWMELQVGVEVEKLRAGLRGDQGPRP